MPSIKNSFKPARSPKMIQIGGQAPGLVDDFKTGKVVETIELNAQKTNSTTVITNLNADLLDGSHAAAFAVAAHTHVLTAGATDVTSSAAELNILDGVTSTATELNVLDGIPVTLTFTELGYCDGVTSAIQTQIDGKAATAHTHVLTAGATDITATAAEVNYIDGVTSAVQTQIDGKQATGNYITALTGEVTATGPGSVAATIANDTVTYAKMQNVSASNVVLGRISPGAGDAEEISTSGTGAVVRATSAALTTPTIGAATATSIAIGANTLDTSEWANLDGVNQALATTSTPQFAKLGLGAAASASAIHYITGNAGGQNVLWLNAGSSNTSPTIQLDSAAGRPIFINKTGGGETILYLVQNDTYNPKFMECYGGGETPILFEVLGTGNIWTVGDCSALTFTDRTPYPATLQEAYDAIASIEGINGKVDHQKLHAFVKNISQKIKYDEITKKNEVVGTETGRNVSATISALVEIIKDLKKRLEILETK